MDNVIPVADPGIWNRGGASGEGAERPSGGKGVGGGYPPSHGRNILKKNHVQKSHFKSTFQRNTLPRSLSFILTKFFDIYAIRSIYLFTVWVGNSLKFYKQYFLEFSTQLLSNIIENK